MRSLLGCFLLGLLVFGASMAYAGACPSECTGKCGFLNLRNCIYEQPQVGPGACYCLFSITAENPEIP